MPLVSILLPARNAAPTLGAAVQSMVRQSFADWELLVVDDGSTDATAQVAGAWATQDPRVRLLRQPARGIVRALQHGLDASQGNLVARMDADDVSQPDRVGAQVRFLEAHPEIGLVACQVAFGGDRVACQGYALHVDWMNGLVSPEQIRLKRFIESPFAHPSVLFRRELVAQFGGYREGPFPEDYELWLRWLDAGVAMAKVPQVLLTWNDPPGRLSRTDPRYATAAFYRLKAGYLARAVQHTRQGRAVWVWGAGRPTRVRAEHLTRHGVAIAGYVDIDPQRVGRAIGGRPIVAPNSMPGPGEAQVLVYVGTRGARDLIWPQLCQRGFVEGRDFWLAA